MVVSVISPEEIRDSFAMRPDDVNAVICGQMQFFASAQAARDWLADHRRPRPVGRRAVRRTAQPRETRRGRDEPGRGRHPGDAVHGDRGRRTPGPYSRADPVRPPMRSGVPRSHGWVVGWPQSARSDRHCRCRRRRWAGPGSRAGVEPRVWPPPMARRFKWRPRPKPAAPAAATDSKSCSTPHMDTCNMQVAPFFVSESPLGHSNVAHLRRPAYSRDRRPQSIRRLTRRRTDADPRTVDLSLDSNKRPTSPSLPSCCGSPITSRQIGCLVVQSIFV
jgi:hypothetical protein